MRNASVAAEPVSPACCRRPAKAAAKGTSSSASVICGQAVSSAVATAAGRPASSAVSRSWTAATRSHMPPEAEGALSV